MTPTLRADDEVQVLVLGDDENRFTNEWLDTVADLLDEAVGNGLPLVTTGDGPQYSSGLDLAWLQANPTEFQPYISTVNHLLAMMLTLPLPTVAAINGHCFAAGAMFALCHDQRVMRTERGWWCLPEIDVQLPFNAGMDALLRATLRPDVARRAMTTGHRYTAEEALAANVVDEVRPVDQVLDAALDRARAVGAEDVDVLGQIKRQLHADAVASLRGE